MITIQDIANELYEFLDSNEEVKDFHIFIRVNFEIEVFVFTSSQNDLINEFYKEHENCKQYRIKFNIQGEDDIDDPFNECVVKSEKINWGARYRFDSLLNRSNRANSSKYRNKKPSVITFYSYKGGMGRTTTMVAYAMYLALNKNKRVVAIDCDLEAPGYLNFFNLSEHKDLLKGKKNGLVEFFSDVKFSKNSENINVANYVLNAADNNDNKLAYDNLKNIWIVPAGNLNEGLNEVEIGGSPNRQAYLEGLSRLNLANTSSVLSGFKTLIDKIVEFIDPDFILIDSRTGFNDVFGTTVFHLSDSVVGFFGRSKQTQPGLANLLTEYYKGESNFRLHLVSSILPEGENVSWSDIQRYIDNISDEEHVKNTPSFLTLHRNNILEKVGSEEGYDQQFLEVVQNGTFDDFNKIFEVVSRDFIALNEHNRTKEVLSENTPSSVLRNVVLRRLKESLSTSVSLFAEQQSDINEDVFLYRDCMKMFFEKEKYIIQGYKGTGKTYLYRAFANNCISRNIQKWAGRTEDRITDTIFVNILPIESGKGNLFENIDYENKPYIYFTRLWQIYTWNALLLNPRFVSIKEQSRLREYVTPINGSVNATLLLFDELVDNGIKTLAAIEEDFSRLNLFLEEKHLELFVLYDRLDTCINPVHWSKAVSPLIRWWSESFDVYSNIIPKIFIRTDLFRHIEMTNSRNIKEDRIISIEWSIGEVFNFFFKLIMSDRSENGAYAALYSIAKKIHKERYIADKKKILDRFPENQFDSVDIAQMSPIIDIVFGEEVHVKGTILGKPWDYFKKELSNADRKAISLRPFINTMNGNAIDEALSQQEKFVKEIISSEIYASREVRVKTTKDYFEDLAQDSFSKDLLKLREVITTSGDEIYNFKALKDETFQSLLKTTFERISDRSVVKSIEDLKEMVLANGIIAEYPTTNGIWWRFAPIYHYSWGLKNSAIDKEEKMRNNKDVKLSRINLIDGKKYEGKIVEVENKYGRKSFKVRCDSYSEAIEIRDSSFSDFIEGDDVWFVARKEPHKTKPNAIFWYADNVTIKD